MIERTATIAATVGLHARPAAIFAEAAAEYDDLEITIAATGEPVEEAMDATSVLSLMSLGVAHGDTVVLRAQGKGAEDALVRLVQILETNHDAE
ncbi:HPr family phosphocarrier protein [Kocuria arenosa]|uniref:HPr family phosphocarrier protein n=1 Tax=Kocuria arenosa TaxID=3071446 RepID=UPI0034D58FD1